MTNSVSHGRRGRLEIIAEMLHACRGYGVKKTQFIYQCNMSFTQLETYLELILKAEFIQVQYNNPDLLFRISEKGRRFLKTYEDMKALME